jgi:hypothetical protein
MPDADVLHLVEETINGTESIETVIAAINGGAPVNARRLARRAPWQHEHEHCEARKHEHEQAEEEQPEHEQIRPTRRQSFEPVRCA